MNIYSPLAAAAFLLGASVLGVPALGQAPPPAAHPPVAIPFTLTRPGFVTLVIEDAKGRRVRNLVSETSFPAGRNVAYWDGLDDLGRNPDAAAHGVYDLPGRLVRAGAYRVRGLVRPPIAVRYEMMPYTHGDPGWDAAPRSSGWLGNHTPPQATVFVPEKDAKLGPVGSGPGGQVLVGSYVTEGGSGLAWLDLSGRKQYGQMWVGGVWSGAASLAYDAGTSPVPGTYAYASSAWDDELRLYGLVTKASKGAGTSDTRLGTGDDRAVLVPSWKFPAGFSLNERSPLPGVRGVAAHDGLLAVSLPALHQILFVDAAGHRALGVAALPDPRGVAFDAQGRLLALSGKTLLRFRLPAALCASRRLDPEGWTATASVNTENALRPFGGDPNARWSTNGRQAPGQWYALDMGARRAVSSLVLTTSAPQDSPRAYEVLASDDGQAWGTPLARGEGARGTTTITFPRTVARFLKIIQTGTATDSYWSINTLDAFDGPDAAEIAKSLAPPDGGLGTPLELPDRPDTRWSSGAPQTPGQSFQVDLGAARVFTGLTLTSASASEYPRGFQVFVSENGQDWGQPVAEGAGQQAGPDSARVGLATAAFPRVTARFLKIVQTGRDGSRWTIDTLRIFSSPARALPGGERLVASGLQDPQGITLDAAGRIYVSDGGTSHQVKVFSPKGIPVRAIGHAGVPGQGKYDPLHMNNPLGITIDSGGRLWVAEHDFQPKRVSVWDTKTGALVNAFYGPYSYGGGGVLDPQDRTLFHYAGMTLKLDWKTGAARPVDVYYRPRAAALDAGTDWPGAPSQPLYAHGHKYMTQAFTHSPTNGAPFALLWRMDPDGVARAVAGMGRANEWSLLKTAPFRACWPQGTDPDAGGWWYGDGAAKNACLFVWNDLNGNGRPEPAEVVLRQTDTGSVTVAPDLSFLVSRVSARAAGGTGTGQVALRCAPVSFTASGAPRYRLDRAEVLSTGAQAETSTGMGQALLGTNGWAVLTTAPRPFSSDGVGGSHNGVPLWQYPSLWPGLHPSHNAPMPDRPGELIGTTRLLGNMVTPRGSDAGPLWAVNGNKGNVYLFTQDGLFVATLFQDSRTKGWDAPAARRGMAVSGLSLQEESFYPTLTQTQADGRIYLQGNGCLLSTQGLEGIKRLPDRALSVTPALLAAAQAYFVSREAARQQAQAAGQGPLTVALRPSPPRVDGRLDDWAGAEWATIDRRVLQQGDWGHAAQTVEAALAVSGDRLYAAWKTGDAGLLQSRPEALQNLFKSGGALDIQLGAVAGGERLLVTQTDGKTVAVLYRPHVPGTATDPVKFVSLLGLNKTTLIDRVDDVSRQVTLAGADGSYELSVPLSLLGLSPRAGQGVQGDVGILRGNGYQTLQRVYWHNKATGLVSDLASEAELTPALWGRLQFIDAP